MRGDLLSAPGGVLHPSLCSLVSGAWLSCCTELGSGRGTRVSLSSHPCSASCPQLSCPLAPAGGVGADLPGTIYLPGETKAGHS